MLSELISVLIPSRGRPSQLRICVERLQLLADSPDAVEFLLRLDYDDGDSLECFRELSTQYPAVAIVDDSYAGWRSNHRFYNELARLAEGAWLFLFNDDATMLTEGWDTAIRQANALVLAPRMLEKAGGPAYQWRAPDGQRMTNCFPVVQRRAYEALGQFSRHRHTDVYWERLVGPAKLQQPVCIDIQHTPSSSTTPHIRGKGWWDDFNSEPLRSLLQEDLAKLKKVANE